MRVIQTLISDIYDAVNRTLVYRGSDHYGDLRVFDQGAIRVLTFGSIYQQSAYYPSRPFVHVHDYTRVMMTVLGFVDPRHVTLLGLGGGTLLRSAHRYLQNCYFNVVELRQAVYDVAKEYFEIPDDERVRVSIGDAMRHLETVDSYSTDVIFSDLYDAWGVSPAQNHSAFYRECERALTSHGWLVVNCTDRPKRDSAAFLSIRKYFTDIRACECDFGNHIIFASSKSAVSDDTAKIRLSQLEKAFNEPHVSLYRRIKPVSE